MYILTLYRAIVMIQQCHEETKKLLLALHDWKLDGYNRDELDRLISFESQYQQCLRLHNKNDINLTAHYRSLYTTLLHNLDKSQVLQWIISKNF